MKQQGQILIQALLLSALAVVIIVVLSNVAIFHLNSVTSSYRSEQAFQIAEAGIEYYRWHLAHAPSDYTNGTGQPGPYTIPYKDKDGNVIGDNILDIIAPADGSTIVTVRSTGKLNSGAGIPRTIEAKLGVQSFAKYAILANDSIRLGTSTIVSGRIHSNNGVRFDGQAYNIVSSSKYDYDDPDHTGPNEYGVHTHADVPPAQGSTNEAFRPQEAPPNPVQNRQDIFKVGRQFPIPTVDYNALTASLAQIKADAQVNGLYLAGSGALGYEIVLRPNDTLDVYRVTSLRVAPSGCTNSNNETGWDTWSIGATTTVGSYPIPANRLIFIEDHVWISGKVDTARLTIGSARFPENPLTNTNITVNDDLTYTNYDGSDVIGLVAQNNINTGLWSKDDLRIDAALVAKNGRIGRYYYRKASVGQDYCGAEALRNRITLFGMIATNKRYGFSWVCGANYCSGYFLRDIVYDANLLYRPPPSFPASSGDYELISWEEKR